MVFDLLSMLFDTRESVLFVVVACDKIKDKTASKNNIFVFIKFIYNYYGMKLQSYKKDFCFNNN